MKAKRYDNLKSNLCFICNSQWAWLELSVVGSYGNCMRISSSEKLLLCFFNFSTIYISILTFFNIESDFIKYLQNTQAFKKLLYIITIHCFYFSSKDHAVELAFFLLYFSKFFSKGQILNANNVLIAVLSWQF